mgnify:CR=1 FL=1
MKIVLTGGTGLIGRHFSAALVERGDEVICVSRKAERARLKLSPGVAVLEADPTVAGRWQDSVADCDVVVNLAGEPLSSGRWTSRRKKRFRRSRLETTRRVVEGVRRSNRVKLLISASAVGIYGDGGREPQYEERQASGDFLGRLAHEWESCALEAADATRIVLARFGVVLASSDGALPRMAVPFRWGLGGPLGNGKQYLPWIHIDDVLRVLFYMIEQDDLIGPVNVVAPDPPTQREFAALLGEVLGRPARVTAPAWVLRLLLGEMADMVLSSYRAVPKALRAKSFAFEHKDLRRSLADLLE